MTKNFKKLKSLHELPTPLILYNCWDVASARAIQQGGAPVIATSSYAIAESLGAVDGEHLTFDEMFLVISRIAKNVSLPLTVDIETGYARNLEELAQNVERLLAIGVCGVNLEDQLIGVTNPGLCSTEEQCDKIETIKETAAKMSTEIFINARTDVFFQGRDGDETVDLLEEAIDRAKAYKEAGADAIFIPGLLLPKLIRAFVEKSPLPVNVMRMDGMLSNEDLQKIGVKRISYGPFSFFQANLAIQLEVERIFEGGKAL
ncbi:isocitrate lyase/phosphoenolpyruvate mutase family protein [Listeria monocytogenes]|uniref:isocitrate lyase/PEP mutase family protein n=2 Tax=Listeria monocytogenes TaxID=1639 RepID=UPI00074D67A1|nr:isocitrate lyase/phosphoenolpyruvate mutase family protein [Listeria monocytogenes]EAA0324941.1 isocitrate lyase/phosphoenolpyruvate mutase family protein [Listeria monocytogenes]EAC6633526.1 isocitrate lyase/phosphoenolpyruvate mutase family protein [Listeria monocytogenes]EAD0235441.1 isocitrate lyase/phosphoenolpyruvate mutase family protein [Listeria monocytogenes]EAD6088749.1 isocitrate lyase/phosphoenolpyruvate mutase family protein [Listeria monocytogenes]EAD9046918.1 isocitrate lyas